MRPDLKLEIDRSTSPSVSLSAFRPLALGSAATLPAPPIEDHLDLYVVAEPIQQIFVKAGFVSGDQKQMSGHVPPF